MKQVGCTRVAVANDKTPYGAGLAGNVAAAAPKQGLKVTGNTPLEMLLFNLWGWGQIEIQDPQDLQRYCDVTARAVKWPGGAPNRSFELATMSSSTLFT